MSAGTEPPLDNSSGPGARALAVACVFGAGGLVVTHAVRLGHAPAMNPWLAGSLVLAALPAADLLSGLIHWAGDTWGRATTPWLGPRLLVPFRYHHRYPRDMLRSGFFTTNGDTALVSCLFLGAAFLVPPGPVVGRYTAAFAVAFAAWGLPTSQIHKWAHTPCPPRPVRWLQRAGLILGPVRHAIHHRPPHADYFCITTGWCNPILSRIGFFAALERLVSRATGLVPRADAAGDPGPAGRAGR
jgi:hypothetical protein